MSKMKHIHSLYVSLPTDFLGWHANAREALSDHLSPKKPSLELYDFIMFIHMGGFRGGLHLPTHPTSLDFVNNFLTNRL